MSDIKPDPITSSFLQPKRRTVRQRSGFKVGGGKTGSECFIYKTDKFRVVGKELLLSFIDSSVKFTYLFSEKLSFFGVGIYIRSSHDLLVPSSLQLIDKKETTFSLVENKAKIIPKNTWTRIGFYLEVNPKKESDVYRAEIKINLISKEKGSLIEVFGFQAGPIDYYKDKKSYKGNFYEKTELYEPEIYYIPYKKFNMAGGEFIGNCFIIGKSCNRCARLLPIDIENELNPLGFSNHCKKRAPCKHNAFSRYMIENSELIQILPKKIKDKIVKSNKYNYLPVHFGFQLECRSCKKFEVNAPLNPMRNKAQHHEDGARRRAFERMIIDLTKQDVVKNFRFIHGEEFQDYIWEKFNKVCFACNKPLPKVSDMDIDHTFPLAYLWPLDETATSLCKNCNSLKHEAFPQEFSLYTPIKLKKLSKLTGLPLSLIASKKRVVNPVVLKLLKKNTVWLFDDFLSREDYQKIKKGKRISDLIYKALQKVLTPENVDLIKLYFEETGEYPKTITLS